MDTNTLLLSLQLVLPAFNQFAQKADLGINLPLEPERMFADREAMLANIEPMLINPELMMTDISRMSVTAKGQRTLYLPISPASP